MNFFAKIKKEINFKSSIKKAAEQTLKDFNKDLTIPLNAKSSKENLAAVKSQMINEFFEKIGNGSFTIGLNTICDKYGVSYGHQSDFLEMLKYKIN